MTDTPACDPRLVEAGWTVDRISLYDEEGVEGWIWTSPSGAEHTIVGDWNEAPEMPDEVAQALRQLKYREVWGDHQGPHYLSERDEAQLDRLIGLEQEAVQRDRHRD